MFSLRDRKSLRQQKCSDPDTAVLCGFVQQTFSLKSFSFQWMDKPLLKGSLVEMSTN